jgi:hypothetical protein
MALQKCLVPPEISEVSHGTHYIGRKVSQTYNSNRPGDIMSLTCA